MYTKRQTKDEHTHYLRGSCNSSKCDPTDGNDCTSLGGRAGMSAECRPLACPRLCTYCTRVAYGYLHLDHLRSPATARTGPGPRGWSTRALWDVWNGRDRGRQNVELGSTAAWGGPPQGTTLFTRCFAPPMTLRYLEALLRS